MQPTFVLADGVGRKLARPAGMWQNVRTMLESSDPKVEFVNYYGNTSLFALSILRQYGPLHEMSLLSVGCRMAHLADYLGLFRTVHHSTMTTTHLPVPPGEYPARLVLHRGDFFDLEPMEVDCIISQAVIHCFNDSRYGNARGGSAERAPYQAAAKLRRIVGARRVPAVICISVHREEGFFDNNTHLSHDRFVASFEQAGFTLKDYFFDYVCGGIRQRPEYFDYAYRRAKTLPATPESPREWIAGNYYFV